MRGTLALMVAATGIWDFVLLDRTPTWLPWLRYVVLVAGVVVAVALLIGTRRLARSATVLLLVTAVTGVAARPRTRWTRRASRTPVPSPPPAPRARRLRAADLAAATATRTAP